MQKIFVDKTNIYAFKNMIKSINEQENNIIIVPDKFSLNSEQLFFEENNLTVSFSTQTFSLTKLASKILEKKLIDKKIIDKNISIMLISTIINENSQNFKYFKNIKNINEFSADVYNFIAQILSSKVLSFNESLPPDLKNKLDDIKLILSEYQKKQKEILVDASFKFDLFLEEIKNSELIKKTNFYFGMFNSLTTQVKNIIKEIAKYAKSVSFSASKSDNRVNNNEIFEFYKSLNENSEVIETNSLFGFNKFIINNFFTTNSEKFEIKNNNIKLFEAKSVEDEIDNVIYEIRKEIFVNNTRLKDIAICLGDFKNYSKPLKNKLTELNIPIFVDENTSLSEFGFARFILTLLKCLDNFSVNDVLKLLKSGYIDIESKRLENFENFLTKLNIQSFSEKEKINCFYCDEFFVDYIFVLENFVSPVFEFKKEIEGKSCTEFFNDFESLLEKLGAKKQLNQKIEDLKLNDILKYKQYSQIEDKIKQVFDCICEFYKDNLSIEKIIYFVSLCFENTFISLPPVSVDSIFVGDSVNSYFKTYKKLYILGADVDYPSLLCDNSIFLESELTFIEKNNEINPKPSIVNRINYYKCFENMLCSVENLTISYSLNKFGTQNYPSLILKNFLKFFNENEKPVKMLKINNDVLSLFENNQILNLLALKMTKKEDFIKNYYLTDNLNLKNVLERVIKDKTDFKFEEIENKIDKNLIDINVFSSSSLEDYFGCSKKFFYKDFLKLKPKEKIEFDAKVVGNIVHSCCKNLADEIIKSDEEINQNKQNCLIEKVFNEKKYKFLKTMDNGETKIKNLKNEISKLFDFILNQQKQSKFKISKAEYAFLEEINGKQFKGFVDRVDETENEFIIIDYKTGSTKIEYSDIVMCKKIQLLFYAKILEKKLNKKCKGVYYLTVSDDYSVKNKHKIYFNGITVNENNMIHNLGDKDFFEFKDKYLLTQKEFEKLENYVFEKVLDAVSKIQNAEFKENPIFANDISECDYCDYSEICAKKEKYCFEFDENMIKEILND